MLIRKNFGEREAKFRRNLIDVKKQNKCSWSAEHVDWTVVSYYIKEYITQCEL
jgi:hypothetical protein